MKKVMISKNIHILTAILICTCTAGGLKCAQKMPTQYLLDYSKYQKITLENIKSLKIIRVTEGGKRQQYIDNKTEIKKIYNYLKQIKLTSESVMGCDDNTTVYSFVLRDNTKVSIEVECDWIVLEGKNYNFKLCDSDKK